MSQSRRELLVAAAAWPLRGASKPVRYAICSETFAGASFAEACHAARRTGYEGIEIDPAQLSDNPAMLPPERRREIRDMMREAGLEHVGLHSFLRVPGGMHLTTADAAVRTRSWEYFRRLVDLAADFGNRPVMVLGSAKQRMAADGVTPQEAVSRLVDGLRGLAPTAEARGVRVLMEPLAPQLCNVVTTLARAVDIVRAVASPAVRTIFDTHNTAAEKEPPSQLIRGYLPYIEHVHLNEMDGRRPGAGNYPFSEVLRALKEVNYSNWISVEVFDFKPDGETVARQAREFLRRAEQAAGGGR